MAQPQVRTSMGVGTRTGNQGLDGADGSRFVSFCSGPSGGTCSEVGTQEEWTGGNSGCVLAALCVGGADETRGERGVQGAVGSGCADRVSVGDIRPWIRRGVWQCSQQGACWGPLGHRCAQGSGDGQWGPFLGADGRTQTWRRKEGGANSPTPQEAGVAKVPCGVQWQACSCLASGLQEGPGA